MSDSVIARSVCLGTQLLSTFLWFVLWWLLLGFPRLQVGFWWYIPLILFTAMESIGIMVETHANGISVEYEMTLIKQIEDNVERVVTAIAILAAIPAFLIGKGDVPLPTEFFSLIFIAAVAILGGALSWFGAIKNNSPRIVVVFIRQIKTESYRHSLTWTLAAIIALFDWIKVNI